MSLSLFLSLFLSLSLPFCLCLSLSLSAFISSCLSFSLGLSLSLIMYHSVSLSPVLTWTHWARQQRTAWMGAVGTPPATGPTSSISRAAPPSAASSSEAGSTSAAASASAAAEEVDPRPLAGTNPVANAGAVVVTPDGVVRLTVLTSRLLRIEYARDGVFEDAATFAFIHRRLPVPTFTQRVEDAATGGYFPKRLVLETEHLVARYNFNPDTGPAPSLDAGEDKSEARFTQQSLEVVITFRNGSTMATTTWFPGKPNPQQLPGTVRTLDSQRGSMDLTCDKLPPQLQYGKVSQLCTMGIISRAGWALVDDTPRPRFDDDPDWPWVQDPPSRPYRSPTGTHARLDWYLFAHGCVAVYLCICVFLFVPPSVPLCVSVFCM